VEKRGAELEKKNIAPRSRKKGKQGKKSARHHLTPCKGFGEKGYRGRNEKSPRSRKVVPGKNERSFFKK